MDGEARFDAGETIVPEGEKINYSSLLFAGIACREKINFEGERQIAELQIPGDFIDLHSYPLERLDHTLTALTECKIAKLYHDDIDALIDERPRFARILWFATMTDASIHREWIQNLGTRSGLKRMGHLFCEMYSRMDVVGLVENNSFAFPLTQAQLGEALGFTFVHVNRVVKQLRAAKLADHRDKRVYIEDFERLAEFCGFDPAYLYLTRRER
ncbi:Crp/Fnr family transcriptional regulator [Erythrobacter sp. HI0063]|jgi:CRP-like cAMP-binding protein|uniref:Crp/Fnr family transcriptional regulator n=1 Tax=Erythrobacter sp. HI0063 TaxID=1822240 RepID=UPI0009EE02BF|nr:Crp/Fnr family transcriptional regulator [Erythrobacter sp. HI0063]